MQYQPLTPYNSIAPLNDTCNGPRDTINMKKIVMILVFAFVIYSLVMWWRNQCTGEIPVMTDFALPSNRRDVGNVYNLTPTNKNVELSTVPIEIKHENDRAVKRFLHEKSNLPCMVMIWAYWCPHCTNSIPKFVEAARQSKTPYVLIHAEVCTDEITRTMFDVTHFPYITTYGLEKNMVLTDISVENLMEMDRSMRL